MSTAELRLHLQVPRSSVTARHDLAAVAAVMVFRYAGDSSALFGVAPWLFALHFGFGVGVAVLAEIGARARQPG